MKVHSSLIPLTLLYTVTCWTLMCSTRAIISQDFPVFSKLLEYGAASLAVSLIASLLFFKKIFIEKRPGVLYANTFRLGPKEVSYDEIVEIKIYYFIFLALIICKNRQGTSRFILPLNSKDLMLVKSLLAPKILNEV